MTARPRQWTQVFFQKMRLIYVPFLTVTVGFVVTYSLVAWSLVYKTSLLAVDEELITFWLPFGLGLVAGWIWVWPRLGVLRLESSTSRFREIFLFLAVGTMVAPP